MPIRPGALLDRIHSAGRILLGREKRFPPEEWQSFSAYGLPHSFKPKESLQAMGNNVYLYRSVLTISMELARTNFQLRTRAKKNQFKYIESHQALETLAKPQITSTGKSMAAGILMLPYLGWVAFATVLNFTIWRRNA
jgi:hypothetical protein